MPALQAIDKEYLVDMTGFVEAETLERITAQILNYLGVVPAGSVSR